MTARSMWLPLKPVSTHLPEKSRQSNFGKSSYVRPMKRGLLP